MPFNTSDKENPETLTQELKSGSFQAFEALYKLYSGKLYNFVMKISGGNRHTAEEIVQQAFIRLCEVRAQLNPHESLISYLCTIAKNLFLNMHQHQTVEYIYQEYILKNQLEQDNQTEQNINLRFLNDYIDTLMADLPPARRRIFELSKRQHYTNKEIAALLSVSESTVSTQLSLAVKFIREQLTSHYDKILLLLLLYWVNKI